jgi:hypothetical protein
VKRVNNQRPLFTRPAEIENQRSGTAKRSCFRSMRVNDIWFLVKDVSDQPPEREKVTPWIDPTTKLRDPNGTNGILVQQVLKTSFIRSYGPVNQHAIETRCTKASVQNHSLT